MGVYIIIVDHYFVGQYSTKNTMLNALKNYIYEYFTFLNIFPSDKTFDECFPMIENEYNRLLKKQSAVIKEYVFNFFYISNNTFPGIHDGKLDVTYYNFKEEFTKKPKTSTKLMRSPVLPTKIKKSKEETNEKINSKEKKNRNLEGGINGDGSIKSKDKSVINGNQYIKEGINGNGISKNFTDLSELNIKNGKLEIEQDVDYDSDEDRNIEDIEPSNIIFSIDVKKMKKELRIPLSLI